MHSSVDISTTDGDRTMLKLWKIYYLWLMNFSVAKHTHIEIKSLVFIAIIIIASVINVKMVCFWLMTHPSYGKSGAPWRMSLRGRPLCV